MNRMDEFVVRDDVSSAGLRRLHVLRSGQPVDVEALMERYGVAEGEGRPAGSPLLARLVYEDEGLGIYHARLYWRECGVQGA